MTREAQVDRRVLPILIAGFALLIILLAASAFISISAIRSVESDAVRLLQGQRATMHLIDDVQREEDSLSAIFYSLAAGGGRADRARLLKRLDELQHEIATTTEAGAKSGNEHLWHKVRSTANAFIAEGRTTLESGRPPGRDFYRDHETMFAALAELANANFEASSASQTAEAARSQERIRYSLILLTVALALAGVGAIATTWTVNRAFRSVKWQASELAHLSSRAMADQEESARRFSRELHDHFGQTLSAIEANLVAIRHARTYSENRIEDCLALIKDAIENVREVSQLYRPSILDDFGLDASLRWLTESFSERTGVRCIYESAFSERLDGETETHLFRIAQEALTNVARHSGATQVRVELASGGDTLRLTVSDNGKGLTPSKSAAGLGLVGMRARARASHGQLRVESQSGTGVNVIVEIPVARHVYAHQDSDPVSR